MSATAATPDRPLLAQSTAYRLAGTGWNGDIPSFRLAIPRYSLCAQLLAPSLNGRFSPERH